VPRKTDQRDGLTRVMVEHVMYIYIYKVLALLYYSYEGQAAISM
jgi:hypothetical protein